LSNDLAVSLKVLKTNRQEIAAQALGAHALRIADE
jgi:hypothetical protein